MLTCWLLCPTFGNWFDFGLLISVGFGVLLGFLWCCGMRDKLILWYVGLAGFLDGVGLVLLVLCYVRFGVWIKVCLCLVLADMDLILLCAFRLVISYGCLVVCWVGCCLVCGFGC